MPRLILRKKTKKKSKKNKKNTIKKQKGGEYDSIFDKFVTNYTNNLKYDRPQHIDDRIKIVTNTQDGVDLIDIQKKLYWGTILDIFTKTYDDKTAYLWWMRWRIFFMSCDELFMYNKGKEWGISHYLFCK